MNLLKLEDNEMVSGENLSGTILEDIEGNGSRTSLDNTEGDGSGASLDNTEGNDINDKKAILENDNEILDDESAIKSVDSASWGANNSITTDGNTLMNGDMTQDNFSNEKAGISSVTILTIVLIVCAVIGIALGILAGKRSANK